MSEQGFQIEVVTRRVFDLTTGAGKHEYACHLLRQGVESVRPNVANGEDGVLLLQLVDQDGKAVSEAPMSHPKIAQYMELFGKMTNKLSEIKEARDEAKAKREAEALASGKVPGKRGRKKKEAAPAEAAPAEAAPVNAAELAKKAAAKAAK